MEIQLNGQRVATVAAAESGEPALLPTAPNDTLTIGSRDEDRSLLLQRRLGDRPQLGEFIALYRFDSESGSTLVDDAGNDNIGTLQGSPTRGAGGGDCLGFDVASDYVSVSNISAPVQVDEFTVAVTDRQRGVGSDPIDQLVEHTWMGHEWFLETATNGSGGHRLT